MRTSRTWRWKLIAAIVLGVLVIAVSATVVPRWLSSLVSEGGGPSTGGAGGDAAPDSGSHP
jgi:hypothetical protein